MILKLKRSLKLLSPNAKRKLNAIKEQLSQVWVWWNDRMLSEPRLQERKKKQQQRQKQLVVELRTRLIIKPRNLPNIKKPNKVTKIWINSFYLMVSKTLSKGSRDWPKNAPCENWTHKEQAKLSNSSLNAVNQMRWIRKSSSISWSILWRNTIFVTHKPSRIWWNSASTTFSNALIITKTVNWTQKKSQTALLWCAVAPSTRKYLPRSISSMPMTPWHSVSTSWTNSSSAFSRSSIRFAVKVPAVKRYGTTFKWKSWPWQRLRNASLITNWWKEKVKWIIRSSFSGWRVNP